VTSDVGQKTSRLGTLPDSRPGVVPVTTALRFFVDHLRL
jgi:hypothetical protein